MRRTPLPAVVRLGLPLVALSLALASAPVGAALGAQTNGTGGTGATSAPAAGSVAELEQRLREAQSASNAAAARFQRATASLETLVDEIAGVERRIAAGRERAGELRLIAVNRAVTAYKQRDGGSGAPSPVLGSGDVMRQVRRNTLLELANAKDNAAIAELRALEEDLGVQKADLASKRADAERLVTRLDAERATLAATVADAQSAYDALVERLAREAASRAEAERRARLAAAEASRGANAAPPGTPVAGFQCPVRGTFTNDFGDPRSGGRVHAGIDIFAATGTPLFAVKSGSVSFAQEGAGGNAVYLSGSDGNTYYYAHLSSYAGSSRSVAQGEVIGYVGQTGNASAPHLHFEIRTPGGIVNPYASLTASC